MSGTAEDLTKAKYEAERAKQRLAATLGTIRYRLKPGTIASGAWEGVRDKGSELADDAVQAVKERPKTVSMALAAFAIFLARDPIRSVASRLLSGRGDDEDLVTTRLDESDDNFDLTAPVVARQANEGVEA